MNSPSTSTPKNNLSSFVMAPVTAAKNVANSIKNTTSTLTANVANTAKNVWESEPIQSVAQPIQDSYQSALDNNSEGLFSIPVVILLGVLIVFFVLFIIFRDQIVFAMEVAWLKIKGWFSPAEETAVQAPPPEFAPPPNEDLPMVEKSAVEKILPGKKQVFNVATNKFRYSDAEPLCKAFGAELASYDQVKEAWSKGADWCNYGWVKGQAAVYPTQEATYAKLQAGPEDQRGACGVPGVNGGYFDNPDLRFGVNCYGSRPNENDTDVRKKMGADGVMTPDGLAYNRKVRDYKAHLMDIPVNPYNEQVWSE